MTTEPPHARPSVGLPISTAEELRRALHALAQPAATQYSLVPDWLVIGEELASAFHEALEKHRASGASLSRQQASSLDALVAYIADLSGPRDKAFWANPSRLHSDSRWQNIRDFAQSALEAFEWES